MEEWKLRFEHERDYLAARGAQIATPEYGRIVYNKNDSAFRAFNGSEFWPKFKEAGHTDTEFDKCECKKK